MIFILNSMKWEPSTHACSYWYGLLLLSFFHMRKSKMCFLPQSCITSCRHIYIYMVLNFFLISYIYMVLNFFSLLFLFLEILRICFLTFFTSLIPNGIKLSTCFSNFLTKIRNKLHKRKVLPKLVSFPF